MSTYVPEGYGTTPVPSVMPTPATVNPFDLVGVNEIAGALGVTRRTVANWAKSPGFPRPIRSLAMGPLYSLSAVIAWRGATSTEGRGNEVPAGEASAGHEPTGDDPASPAAPPPWAEPVDAAGSGDVGAGSDR
jgi:hypothetical protein